MTRTPDHSAVTAFMANLDADSALRALSLAYQAKRDCGWSDETQKAVTDAIMNLFAERSRARRAGRAVSA